MVDHKIQTAPDNTNGNTLKNTSDPAPVGSRSSIDMRCPDPSAHKTKHTTLQDQASAAALYSTRSPSPTKGTHRKDVNPLGPDGKLSSASAATSLKHAKANELPGFPIVGIDTHTSANAAANLANNNKHSPEWWKPEQSAAAGKAALLAKDYKMAPAWKPEASAAGSKAAVLAAKSSGNHNLWQPEASAEGHSAATIAMKKQGPAPKAAPRVDYGYTEDGRSKALVAATGAVSSSGRKRAQSTPAPPPLYPDEQNSARNALSAATIAASPSMRARKSSTTPAVTDPNRLGSGAMEAARIQHSKSVSREMYTSAPPVALEVEEKRRQDALRASAISMAKKMYDVQQHHINQASDSQARAGANVAQDKQGYSSEADIKEQAMRYIGIQEAAQKLAAERLAKISPDENAAFRSYYGYEKPTRAKLSIRRGRNRASSNPETADSSDEDEFQSRRIRSQMSQLNKNLAEVDEKKRDQDRKYLLAAAQRKVQAQMNGLDKKIFDETGKMSPSMIDEWDAKARARAAAASEARMENHGKIHIGGGKYMDQADIDAVAQARIQPTLDEIAEKTEKRRAEEEERRLELEQRKREGLKEREREAELKAEEKRIRDEEKRTAKARNAEEKAAARQEREAEKEKKAEEKRMAKDSKRKSTHATTDIVVKDAVAPSAPSAVVTFPAPDEAAETREPDNDSLYRDPMAAAQSSHTPEPESTSPTSPTSPKSDSKGIKSFLNKFKRRSKHSGASAEIDKPGFIGGIALRDANRELESHSNQNSVPSSPQPEVPERRYSDVSSVSVDSAFADDRGRGAERTTSGLTETTTKGSEEFEEARDDFDEKLAPPPSFTTVDGSAGRKGSPSRDSRFHEVGI